MYKVLFWENSENFVQVCCLKKIRNIYIYIVYNYQVWKELEDYTFGPGSSTIICQCLTGRNETRVLISTSLLPGHRSLFLTRGSSKGRCSNRSLVSSREFLVKHFRIFFKLCLNSPPLPSGSQKLDKLQK